MIKGMRYKNFQRGIAVLGAVLMMLQSPLGYVAAHGQTVSGNGTVSANSAETSEADLLLNYAYIESAQLEIGQPQNILISAGEEGIAWNDAQLTIVSEDGGEVIAPLSGVSDDVLKFTVDTTNLGQGVYRVAKLTYSYLEQGMAKSGEFDFAAIPDMENVCFGLGVQNPIPSGEFVSYDENAQEENSDVQELLDVNVVKLTGADENAAATEHVAEALSAVSDIAVEAEITGENSAAENAAPEEKPDEISADGRVAGSLVVILDPGHDATHAGASAHGLKEEKLTLKVAKYCKEYLEDTYSDVVVYMTRSGETCPYPGTSSGDCNAARVDFANSKKADVYVSLHFNSTAGGTTTATGAIVFYPNSNYKNNVGSKGATLASKIIEQLAKLGLKNNGIQIRNSEDGTTYEDGSLSDYYGVIRRSKLYGIPAVIVEHAFLNNASDAAFLADEENLEKLGVADAIGIAKAYNLSTEEVEYDAEDLQVTEIDGGNGTFKMSLIGATPVKRIAEIKFKVYPTENKSKVYTYTAELEDKSKGIYSVTGNVSNHGKKTGTYKVIAYAYNAAGKKAQLRSTTFKIEQTKVDTSDIKVICKPTSNEKKVNLTLKGNENAAAVTFKVYSKAGGNKDMKSYKAEKKADGSWKAQVKIANHKSMGDYVVLAYSKSYFGKTTKVKTAGFSIAGPSVSKVQVTKLNLNKGTFRVIVNGAASKAGVKKVSLVIKNSEGKSIQKTYSTKKAKSGYYYADIKMKDFNYRYGAYKISVRVKDGNGIEEIVKKYTKKIEKPVPVISVKLKSKQTKITMKASDLGIAAAVKGVRFKVYNTSKPSVKKTYEAKKGAGGSYSATMKVSDFGKSGTYKIVTYVKGTNGKYKAVGKTKTVKVADVTGGKVSVKKKTKKVMYLTVSDIDYKGSISKVQVKVWPASNTKAKYTYTAEKRSGGAYRATVKASKHKGKGGTYKYQVVVVTKNGITKTLRKGSFTMGQSLSEDGLYAITGSSQATVSQMMAYYKANAKYPAYYANTDAPTLKKFCQLYYNECKAEGIRAEVAFAQAMKETNFLRYGGDVDISQFNFAGIGATGGGAKGNSFASVQVGIRAQVQHLKAYANEEPLNKACVDPRFKYVERGCAPYVEWLGISTNPYGKGWATDPTYGSSLRSMIHALLDC